MDAAALLHDEIRELVRRRGIDPLTESSALEALVAEASADYVTRADAGLVPPLRDPDAAQARVVDALAGLGPSSATSTTTRSRRCGATPPGGSSWRAPDGPS